MKVILAAVTSVNGKITKGNSPHIANWTSKEDKTHFDLLKRANNLLVMGSKTYDAIKKPMDLGSGTLRIVLTGNPQKYEKDEVKGVLEFSDMTPVQLIRTLQKRGFKKMLLVSGGTVTSEFFTLGLIDEIILTLEPELFGNGKNLIKKSSLNASLRLLDVKKANKKGTLFLRFKVL